MLEIKCGDPNGNKPASYTRFILPFAYQLEESKKEKDPEYYYSTLEEGEETIRRKRYLTNETSDVLFRRAKWFRLEKKEGQWEKKFTMPSLESDGISGKTEKDVRLSPPVLILFESPPDLEKAVDKKNPCLLRTGFLVLELYFPEENNKATLDDFLRLNELFRYWQRPFKGHENLFF